MERGREGGREGGGEGGEKGGKYFTCINEMEKQHSSNECTGISTVRYRIVWSINNTLSEAIFVYFTRNTLFTKFLT